MIYLTKLGGQNEDSVFIHKMILYPLILVLCWIWGTINKICMYFMAE